MEHKIVSSRQSGRDGWSIICSCGWRIHHWRWMCEEQFLDHSTPEPQPPAGGRQIPECNEFPNGEFKDEYYAHQGDLRYIC